MAHPFKKFKKFPKQVKEEKKDVLTIKHNKNFGICDILLNGIRNNICKQTLNMFVGQDIRLAKAFALKYFNAVAENNEDLIRAYHLEMNSNDEEDQSN